MLPTGLLGPVAEGAQLLVREIVPREKHTAFCYSLEPSRSSNWGDQRKGCRGGPGVTPLQGRALGGASWMQQLLPSLTAQDLGWAVSQPGWSWDLQPTSFPGMIPFLQRWERSSLALRTLHSGEFGAETARCRDGSDCWTRTSNCFYSFPRT